MRYGSVVCTILVLLSAAMLMCTKEEDKTKSPASAAASNDNPAAGGAQNDDTAGKAPFVNSIGQQAQAAAGPRPKDNGLCYVCHEGMKPELITHVHEQAGVLCIDCHGPSTMHMEDEMLMTEPDVLFGRSEIMEFCRTCHGPHKKPLNVEKFLEEQRGRDQPNGRAVTSSSICTDCHGTHNIANKVKQDDEEAKRKAAWIPVLPGSDLKGWSSLGKAKWTVEDGLLVGAQGEDNAAGDLLTDASYKDFLLTCTLRVSWPCRAGVWFRYQSPEKAYRAEIGEGADPVFHSGTLFHPGKPFIAVSADKDLVDREGWNTLSVQAEGGRIQVWLNGRQVVDVRDESTDSGRIGFHVEGGADFGSMKLAISELMIQPLGGDSR